MAQRPDWSNANLRRLAGLMQVDEQALWGESELGAILQHQLEAPLELELRQTGVGEWPPAGGTPSAGDAAIRTFRELLEDPQPPIELLERTKQYAKSCRSRVDGPLPEEVATVLYLAAIVAARARCGRAISRLGELALRHAVDWALGQPWLDPSVRDLLAGGRAALAAAEEE